MSSSHSNSYNSNPHNSNQRSNSRQNAELDDYNLETQESLDLEESMKQLSLQYNIPELKDEDRPRLDPDGYLDFEDTLLIEEILRDHLSKNKKIRSKEQVTHHNNPVPDSNRVPLVANRFSRTEKIPSLDIQNLNKQNASSSSLSSLSRAPTPETHYNSPGKNNSSDDLNLFYSHFEKLSIRAQYNNNNQTIHPIDSSPFSSTLIVLSPASYDHVFSRSWVTKSFKASIVERPQRLMATAIGVGAALSLHAQTRSPSLPMNTTVISSKKKVDLRNASHVTAVHGSSWAPQLYQLCQNTDVKHSEGKIEVPEDWPYNDIYLAKGTINALEGVVGAVETAVDSLFTTLTPVTDNINHDRAFVAIRPPGHHSHPCAPSGFCLINNAHIAIQYAASKYDVTHAIILDFDLHHGDGSQDICWKLAGFPDEDLEETKPEGETTQTYPQPKLGYFSLHDINSFPTETGYATADNIKNASVCVMAHGMCIWNVHLQKFTDEEGFMKLYDSKYSKIFEKAREFLGESRIAHFESEQEAVNEALRQQQELQHQESRRRRSGRKSGGGNTPDTKSSDTTEEKNIKIPKIRPFKPLIVISAGFDASENETVSMRRHGVYVPTSFYHRFTEDALKLASEYPTSQTLREFEVQQQTQKPRNSHSNGKMENNSMKYDRADCIKVLSLLEGGYSDGAISTGVFSHVSALLGTKQQQEQQVYANEEKSQIKLDPTQLFNPFVTYHFEQACKLRWNPQSVYNNVPSKRAQAAATWAKSVGMFSNNNVNERPGSATKNSTLDNYNGNNKNNYDNRSSFSSSSNNTFSNPRFKENLLKWLEQGLPLGRSLWPSTLTSTTKTQVQTAAPLAHSTNGKNIIDPNNNNSHINVDLTKISSRVLRDRKKLHSNDYYKQ